MKKWTAFLMAACMALTLCACNGGSGTTTETTTETTMDPTYLEASLEKENAEKYARAMDLLTEGEDTEAYLLLLELGEYKDAADYLVKFTVEYTLDSETISSSNTDGAPVSSTVKYVYDENGVLVEKTMQPCNEYYTYDESGNLIQIRTGIKTATQSTTEHTYNEDGQLVSSQMLSAEGEVLSTTQYSYTNGLMTQSIRIVTGHEKYPHMALYSYDEAGRLVTVYEFFSAYDYTTQYTYDENGLLTKMVLTTNLNNAEYSVETTSYSYDGTRLTGTEKKITGHGEGVVLTNYNYSETYHYEPTVEGE
jgi:YD repeat-containing protein